jgi:ribosomal protein L11 methyltransferase
MLEGLPPNGASHGLRLVADERRARAIADLIVETYDPAETAAAAFEEPDGTAWAVEVFFAEAPDEAEVRALIETAAGAEAAGQAQFFEITQKDWVGASLAGLQPVRAGRVLVHGSHDRGRVAANDIGIEIEAALAFGTGHHGTTLGCLRALVDICKRRRPQRILDVGTGTGVLAIAAARLLRTPVACGDADAVAVEVARANALANGVGALVRPVVALGVRHERLERFPIERNRSIDQNSLKRNNALALAGYDLILANILAKPLRLLAPSLAAVAAPEAELVLSGLLARDVAGVLAAYRAQGFALAQRRDIDGWATLVLRRGGQARRPALA